MGDSSRLSNYTKDKFSKVDIGDDAPWDNISKGHIDLKLANGTPVVEEVKYVPSSRWNTIFVCHLVESELKTTFTTNSWCVMNGALLLYVASRSNVLVAKTSNDVDNRT